MIEDLIQSRYILLLSLVFSMILLIIYMILLRYFAQWIIWASLILCIIAFGLAASFCFVARARMQKYSQNNRNNYDNNTKLPDINEINITFNESVLDVNETNKITSTTILNRQKIKLENYDKAMILLDEFAPISIIWLVLGIACCTICFILIICTCCLWERILLAAGRNNDK